MVLLIDESPRKSLIPALRSKPKSSHPPMTRIGNPRRLSRFMIERCRLHGRGRQRCLVLLDSITRVARAYNSVHGGSGRTMTAVWDARALEISP